MLQAIEVINAAQDLHSEEKHQIDRSEVTMVVNNKRELRSYNFTAVIPDGVRTIFSEVFRRSGLTSITLPDTVTTLGSYSFQGCLELTSITLPDSLTNIKGCAFKDCDKLTSITIPRGVKKIGFEAFLDCRGLTSITLPDK